MRSPFKFLDAYTVQDKNEFFGRDNEVEALYSLTFKTNLLIVYGLSGTGKTSVIQCGLASRFDGPDWYPMFIRRNENLNNSIQAALRSALKSDAKEDLVANVSLLMRKTLRPVYLILDQFEELFILGSQEEQDKFKLSLRTLLDSGLNAKVILVLREEYIGQLHSFEQAIPELFDFRFRVEPMGIAKVQSVIQDSFDTFNIHLEEPKQDLLKFMTDQISDPKTGIALPYLQVYLDMLYRETYRKKYGKESAKETLPRLDITRQDIASLGRMSNVLEKFLTQQNAELTEVLKKEYPSFPTNGIQLVLDPFATDEGTKRPVNYVRKGELLTLDPEISKSMPNLPEGSLARAIELLELARILRVREDTIELAHDSLAKIVDQKRTDEQRQLQNIRRRLTNAFEEFQKTGLYLNDKQLASFDEYIPKLGLTEEQQKFIHDSETDITRQASEERNRQHQEQEAKQQKKLARTRGVLLTVALVFAAGAVLMFLKSQANLKEARKWNDALGKMSMESVARADTLRLQQDSIQNILTQVDQQLVRMDAVINGDGSNQKIEIQKVYVTLKSLMSNDTMSEKEIFEEYASVREFETRPTMLSESTEVEPTSEFKSGQDVNAWARILMRKPGELLQAKWFGPDGKIIGSPVYGNSKVIKNGSKTDTVFSVISRFDMPGTYEVKLYNGAGREIDSRQFSVTDEKPSGVTVAEGNFKIVNSVIDKKPGREMSKFRAGSTVYYWARIHCPLENDFIVVQIEMPDGNKWEKKHGINLNTGTGYLVWNAKGFSLAGPYKARILNSSGVEIAAKEFVME